MTIRPALLGREMITLAFEGDEDLGDRIATLDLTEARTTVFVLARAYKALLEADPMAEKVGGPLEWWRRICAEAEAMKDRDDQE